jgi:peroxiredoxin
LTAFSRASRLKEEGVKVVAASVDTEEDAQKTIAECGIDFPVGYGADCQAVARLTGCFYEERRQILHSTGYLLRPDGTIAVGVYSTGPIGRLVWRHVLSLVQLYKQRT